MGAADLVGTEAEAAAGGLQALVSYHRLYQLWWTRPADSSGQEQPEDTLVDGGATEPPGPAQLDFDVLLSEQHADYQAAQRSVKEVQEKLSTMVLQHSRAQGGPAGGGDATDVPDSQSSADAGEGYETFVILRFQL